MSKTSSSTNHRTLSMSCIRNRWIIPLQKWSWFWRNVSFLRWCQSPSSSITKLSKRVFLYYMFDISTDFTLKKTTCCQCSILWILMNCRLMRVSPYWFVVHLTTSESHHDCMFNFPRASKWYTNVKQTQKMIPFIRHVSNFPGLPCMRIGSRKLDVSGNTVNIIENIDHSSRLLAPKFVWQQTTGLAVLSEFCIVFLKT